MYICLFSLGTTLAWQKVCITIGGNNAQAAQKFDSVEALLLLRFAAAQAAQKHTAASVQ